MKRVLVSSYMTDEKQSYFKKVGDALQKHGVELHYINPWGQALWGSPMSHHLSDLREESMIPMEAVVAAEIEAMVRGIEFPHALDCILTWRSLLQAEIDKVKPSLLLLWNQFVGFHRVTHLCSQQGLPFFFAEFGVLPGTLALDEKGQMAESWPAMQEKEFSALPVNEDDKRNAHDFLEYVREHGINRKKQPPEGKLDSFVRTCRNKRRKIIFYAGQFDAQAGIVPWWWHQSKRHSPFFKSTDDLLEFLVHAAEMNNWQILFKPHPGIRPDISRNWNYSSDHLRVFNQVNIHECIDKSDAVVTLVSQVSYEALIRNKPVLLLGRNQLCGKGCVYEPSCKAEIISFADAAVSNGLTSGMQNLWLQHAAQLLKHYLYCFDSSIAKYTYRSAEDMASSIASACN